MDNIKDKLIENWDMLKDETQKQILELVDKEIKEDYFVPQDREIYYTYNIGISDIRAVARSFFGCSLDYMFIAVGNVFRTPEEAEFAGKCDYYTKRFETYVNRHTEKLDWNDYYIDKYYIYYDIADRIIRFESSRFNRPQGIVYASSKQILKNAITDIGEENFLKYVMKVRE